MADLMIVVSIITCIMSIATYIIYTIATALLERKMKYKLHKLEEKRVKVIESYYKTQEEYYDTLNKLNKEALDKKNNEVKNNDEVKSNDEVKKIDDDEVKIDEVKSEKN